MFTIYFRGPDDCPSAASLRVETNGLCAARLVWDALKKDGYRLLSERP